MRHNIIETLVAGTVILVAMLFLLFVLDRTQPETVKSYPLEARFYDAPGLPVGAQVRIAGVPVGEVTAVRLDTEQYVVMVDLMIHEGVLLPSDTLAPASGAAPSQLVTCPVKVPSESGVHPGNWNAPIRVLWLSPSAA